MSDRTAAQEEARAGDTAFVATCEAQRMTVLGASTGLDGMKRLPAGEFAMGSEDFYPEAPVRGPGSDTYTRGRHPVTQVAYEDAAAYAAWAGKALPAEAEWEYAARGGLDGKAVAWGEELAPDGQLLANSWQGEFAWQNPMLEGYAGTSPVGAFAPNGYSLYDMTGNVWEWTCDLFIKATARRRAAGLRLTRASRAASSRAARTCARRTTACASGPPRARVRRSTPRPATSASCCVVRSEKG